MTNVVHVVVRKSVVWSLLRKEVYNVIFSVGLPFSIDVIISTTMLVHLTRSTEFSGAEKKFSGAEFFFIQRSKRYVCVCRRVSALN